MADIYLNNSSHKEYIRDKWVEFASEIVDEEVGLQVITFPAAEMHDLHLFAEKGLIEWERTETGAYLVTKGKVVCFEKKPKYYIALSQKLSNAVIESDEFGSYLRAKYNGIMRGSTRVFPVDIVNLDYDGNISKNRVPIEEVIKLVFEYQSLHKKSFSLFITWPCTEEEDENQYKELLKQIISDNLNDPRALAFKNLFEANYKTVAKLEYDQLSVIGLSKIIIQRSSQHKYHLHNNEFFIYGEEERRKMYSILLNFDYQELSAEHALYSSCVSKSLIDIVDLREGQSAEDAFDIM